MPNIQTRMHPQRSTRSGKAATPPIAPSKIGITKIDNVFITQQLFRPGDQGGNIVASKRTILTSGSLFEAICRVGIIVIFLFIGCSGGAGGGETLQEDPIDGDTRMAWWCEAKFGMFIHWGIYAVPAGMWPLDDGTVYPEPSEWLIAAADISKEDYEDLVDLFDPKAFDADAWVDLAAAAGMKYIVVTAKHHDGFCMWDTDQTDYNIVDRLGRTGAPFRRDVILELSRAAARRGIRFGAYYSILDWHHPAFKKNPAPPECREAGEGWAPGDPCPEKCKITHMMIVDKPAYKRYIKAQLKELYHKYNISIIWLDGQWAGNWGIEDGRELFDFIRTELDNGIIVNDRAAMQGEDVTVPHDYLTFEQGDPPSVEVISALSGEDWEQCMTMDDYWGYHAGVDHWKSPGILIHYLSEIASKGGNYLLNVGPTAEGIIPDESSAILRAMGRWLAVNGDAIYGTTAGAFDIPSPDWGWFTQTPAKLFAHVWEWPEDHILRIPSSAPVGDPPAAFLFLDGELQPLAAERSESGIVVMLPDQAPNSIASIVVMDRAMTGEAVYLVGVGAPSTGFTLTGGK